MITQVQKGGREGGGNNPDPSQMFRAENSYRYFGSGVHWNLNEELIYNLCTTRAFYLTRRLSVRIGAYLQVQFRQGGVRNRRKAFNVDKITLCGAVALAAL